MASLLDDIKNERKGQVGNAEGLIIEQKLNKLFYEKPVKKLKMDKNHKAVQDYMTV